MNDTKYNRTWINYIDSSILDVYPIQFANCDRLQNNDAVYIFDEVGSGKTISSGLMAMDYLFNNPQEEVYVITTNALVRKKDPSEYGQFLGGWYKKLPFNSLGLTNRIKVINNHYSNINQLKSCGLLIIDEAHLFLNDEALRNKCLREIKSKKIVFLTATPIKSSKDDLYKYVEIAKEVLQNQELDDKWIEDIGTEGKSVDSIICNMFNCKYPVTRYFKDTIMSINVEGYEKKQARRLNPQLWEYDYYKENNKNEVMLEKIKECLKESSQSRLVIFTRFVEKEANVIGDFLKSHGFIPFTNNTFNQERTYKVVTGKNGDELEQYEGHNNLPTILILTYQIAEQGVNLPGYNYVINYHISAFPSALEQRFGRIDRMGKSGSIFPEINMCFLISSNHLDTNTWNFYCAMSVYIRNLIPYLPSKNTILSDEIVEKYIDQKEIIKEYIEKMDNLLNSEEKMNSIIKYFVEKNSRNKEPYQDIECECDKDLYNFIDENAIEIDINLLNEDYEKAFNQFKREIINRLKEYKTAFNNEQLSKSQIIEMIKSLGDKVFYQSNGEILTIDAIESGERISDSKEFIEYMDIFLKEVKPLLTAKKHEKIFEEFFEDKFIENDFNSLFPMEGYSHIIEQILGDHDEIDIEDKALLISNAECVVLTLPFFRLCRVYQEIILKMEPSMRWGNEGYDYNQFQSAFYQLYHKIRQDDIHFGLSESFFTTYFDENEEYVEWYDRNYDKHCSSNIYVNSKKYYRIDRNEDNILQASNWYKLAFHSTRKEAWYTDSYRWYSEKENIYYIKEEIIKYLIKNYEAYHKALNSLDEAWYKYDNAYKMALDGEPDDFNPHDMLVEMGIYGEPEQPEIINEYEMKEAQLRKIIQQIEKPSDIRSLFSFYYFTDSGYIRKYSFDKPYIGNGKVLIKDIWTQGIIYELYGQRYNNCMIGNIYPLPEILKDIHMCY